MEPKDRKIDLPMQIATTHKNTDFDALASLVAATILYPDALPVLPKSINTNVKNFLSIHKELFTTYSTGEIDLNEVRSLIVVDTNNWKRIEGLDKLRQLNNLEIILWDHHLNNLNIKSTLKYQEEMGANITLMIRELKAQKKTITPIQATLFLAGLYEDTGHLTFSSSKAEDAYAAAYLLECKADLNIVSSFLRPAYGKKQKKILFEMLQTANILKIDGYNIGINKHKIEGHVENLAVVVRMYREIADVDAAFGVFTNKNDDRTIVIGRSNVDGLNIGTIMQSLGGGGHPGAGSALLKNISVDTIEETIINLIKGARHSATQVADLMSFPVFSVSPDTSMKKVSLILREKGCTGVPVVDNDRLVGIISRRDFRKIRKESQLKAPVRAFMSDHAIAVEPESSPMHAAQIMVKHDIGRLPVIKDGKIVGIITRSDAMNFFYDYLPD